MIISFSIALAIGKLGFRIACSPCLKSKVRRGELSREPGVLMVLVSPGMGEQQNLYNHHPE